MSITRLEHKVNEFLTLKLQNTLTYIYIKGEQFIQCIRLVLQIPKSDVKEFKEIESIDEAALVNKTLHQNTVIEGGDPHDITPEQEFWGHCSNIQAWAEQGYDTRLLHSNIAFPLLKQLVKVGDPKAKEVYKDEVAYRFSSGYLPVISLLIRENYLDCFDMEEKSMIFDDLKAHLNDPSSNLTYPKDLAILNDIGYALNQIGLYDNAMKYLLEALEINSNYSYSLNNLGLSYFHKGNFLKAKEYYEKTIESDPYYHVGWSNLSEIYDMDGDYNESIKLARKAIGLSSKNYEALFFLGHGLQMTGKHDEAIQYYDRAWHLSFSEKEHFSLKDYRIFKCLSEVYIEKGDLKRAYIFCDCALEENKNYEEALQLKEKILSNFEPIINHFNEETGKNAIWGGKFTKSFLKWLRKDWPLA